MEIPSFARVDTIRTATAVPTTAADREETQGRLTTEETCQILAEFSRQEVRIPTVSEIGFDSQITQAAAILHNIAGVMNYCEHDDLGNWEMDDGEDEMSGGSETEDNSDETLGGSETEDDEDEMLGGSDTEDDEDEMLGGSETEDDEDEMLGGSETEDDEDEMLGGSDTDDLEDDSGDEMTGEFDMVCTIFPDVQICSLSIDWPSSQQVITFEMIRPLGPRASGL